MHSGFLELRNTFDTNFVVKYTGDIPVTKQAQREVERILSLWGEARIATAARLGELSKVDNGFLYGGFSIADAFFWPVLWVCFSRGCKGASSFETRDNSIDVSLAISNI